MSRFNHDVKLSEDVAQLVEREVQIFVQAVVLVPFGLGLGLGLGLGNRPRRGRRRGGDLGGGGDLGCRRGQPDLRLHHLRPDVGGDLGLEIVARGLLGRKPQCVDEGHMTT